MDRLHTHSRAITLWLLFLPTLAWCYVGLFLTIQIWYPQGLDAEQLRSHIVHFSIIYVLWLIVFFVYNLFDLETFRRTTAMIARLAGATVANALLAISYFYFQPELIITPRRFLLVHLIVTTVGLALWYWFVQYLLPRSFRRSVYLHPQVAGLGLEELIDQQGVRGLQLAGTILPGELTIQHFMGRPLMVLPPSQQMEAVHLQAIFNLRRAGVDFVEYDLLFERLTRTIPLSALTDTWFLRHIDYGHRFFDMAKRVLDIVVSLIGNLILVIVLAPIAVLIKLSSPGPVFFVQERVGKDGYPFRLYKFRTMSGGVTNTWTASSDARITPIGKLLRKLRLDELPQFINIFQGDMSMVGPRPEQVHIVEQLKQQIPYYDERHIVKPGLTGWAQLHIYAGSLEETKRKLQYDLYYIKHRSLLFDIEIILRTIYKVLTFGGR